MSIPFGKYQLQCKLADGGMAEVFLARQTGVEGFEKLVVCKRIRPELSQDAGFVQMFLNEARVAARLNHPNVVQIFELGRVEATYFITMEFIHGEDLRTLTQQAQQLGQPPPFGLSCRILADTLAGLHYAHTRPSADGQPLGLVHRDVSPQNVLVTYEGGVKLVDFGIAKVNQRGLSEQTKAGLFKGKFAYMSPEQSRGLKLDARSDIFAAGVLLWELLTWTRLFKRPNDMATLVAVAEETIPSPRSIDPRIPAELERISMRALERDLSKRYPTAQEMRADLEQLIRAQSWEADALALAGYMNRLFARKLASQARDVAASGRGSLEDFLLALDDSKTISWIGPARLAPARGGPESMNGLAVGGAVNRDALLPETPASPAAADGEVDELPATATTVSSMPDFAEHEAQPEPEAKAEPTPTSNQRVALGSRDDDLGFLATAARAGVMNTAPLAVLPLPEAKTTIGVAQNAPMVEPPPPPAAPVVATPEPVVAPVPAEPAHAMAMAAVPAPTDLPALATAMVARPTGGETELPAMPTSIADRRALAPEQADLPALSTAITSSARARAPTVTITPEEPRSERITGPTAITSNDARTGSHSAIPEEGRISTQVGARSQAALAQRRRMFLFAGATIATIITGVIILLVALPSTRSHTPGATAAIDIQLGAPGMVLVDGKKVPDDQLGHVVVKAGAEHVVVLRRDGKDIKSIHVPALRGDEVFLLKLR